MAKEVWANMEKSNWIQDGKKDAPRTVYLFSDPNCPYCNMFWEQARPWVDSGKVQLRHIMVGIIREDSPGKSAALLSAKDPQQALLAHEKAGKASTLKALSKIPADVQAKLDANAQLMNDLELSATPAIFYLDDQGNLQQQQGAPSPDKLVQILGPKYRIFKSQLQNKLVGDKHKFTDEQHKMLFVTTPTHFYGLRLLTGAAEAGFFPGVVLTVIPRAPNSLA